MSNIKSEILKLIDENRSPWVKAAFYSNPRVSSILEKLIDLWEANNRVGIPLDYATKEELEELYNIALSYAYMSDEEARSHLWSISGKSEGSFLSFIRRLLKR
ncbi:MAG: hypothetical protein QXR02_00755 [Acidilobaceae archaeon]